MEPPELDLAMSWVILTMGDRPSLGAAVRSVLADPSVREVVVVANGVEIDSPVSDDRVTIVLAPENLGVPGGRHLGIRHTSAALVGFLDDDAEVTEKFDPTVVQREFGDPRLGAMSLRIEDEEGAVSRRHVPRVGTGSDSRSGPVGYFLGGASIIRRAAYDAAGGYWPELFYAHEELDLSWRMADCGWGIRYEASCVVRHPRTTVSGHADGWFRTGRNRVMVARRNLPLPLLIAHVTAWAVVGAVRARSACLAYLRGWWRGWYEPVDRRPMSWATAWALTRLGRPPIL